MASGQTVSTDNTSNTAFEAWVTVRQGVEEIGNGLGRTISALADVLENREAFTKLLKAARQLIAAYSAVYGEHSALSRVDSDWEKAVNLMEGVQFIVTINELFFKKGEAETVKQETVGESSLLDRISDWSEKATSIAFCISDCAGGCLWMLSMEIPVLGQYSKVIKVVVFIGQLADAAALAGFTADIISTLKDVSSFNNLGQTEKEVLLLRIAENTTTAACIVFGFVGVTAAPLTIGLGFAASAFGVVRFVHKQHNCTVNA
jgi:hypothetical protein